MQQLSSWTFYDNQWIDGNPSLIGPLSHGAWMGSPVFDGARVFNGLAPDLMLHCERVVRSAEAMLMTSPVSAEEIFEITKIGVSKFDNVDLYIRPLIWAEDSMGLLRCDPNSAKFCVSIIEMPMPSDDGLSACISKFQKPSQLSAPTDAKAACLTKWCKGHARGFERFQQAIMLDQDLKVANLLLRIYLLSKMNNFYTEKTDVFGGITETCNLSCENNKLPIEEVDLSIEDVGADEVFSTETSVSYYFNLVEDKEFELGAIYSKLRKLYFDFARNCKLF